MLKILRSIFYANTIFYLSIAFLYKVFKLFKLMDYFSHKKYLKLTKNPEFLQQIFKSGNDVLNKNVN